MIQPIFYSQICYVDHVLKRKWNYQMDLLYFFFNRIFFLISTRLIGSDSYLRYPQKESETTNGIVGVLKCDFLLKLCHDSFSFYHLQCVVNKTTYILSHCDNNFNIRRVPKAETKTVAKIGKRIHTYIQGNAIVRATDALRRCTLCCEDIALLRKKSNLLWQQYYALYIERRKRDDDGAQ